MLSPFSKQSGQYYLSVQFNVSIFWWHTNIDNEYLEQMVDTIYPKEIQLNKTHKTNTFTPNYRFFFIYIHQHLMTKSLTKLTINGATLVLIL